jgi:hypothetical protein
MKNTYIIALTNDLEPIYIKQRSMEDISYIGRNYYRAYICETKTEADKIRKDRYNTYANKKLWIEKEEDYYNFTS